MKVIRADALGMCFGVRDALAAIDAVAEPANSTIHGELVHNEDVLARLRERGFTMSKETSRADVPATELVVITAHGISDKEHRRLERAGKRILDTTCPLVRRVHRAAQALEAAGYHVLVIGRHGHVEVQGVVEDLSRFTVVASAAEVKPYPFDRLGIVCQTTAAPREVADIRAAIRASNPRAEIRFVDTVCQPTKDRQAALERLIGQVDAVVVIGGRNSNNTQKLVALCEANRVHALHIQDASDLNPEWFRGCRTVGLTAGTSTPEETIENVHRALLKIATSLSTALERAESTAELAGLSPCLS
jgi:4-hydroxy-3-methylbut-2-enyl diphosphate reductase